MSAGQQMLFGGSWGPSVLLASPVTLFYFSGGLLPAVTGYKVDSDGSVYTAENASGAYTIQQAWISDPTKVADFEVRATVVSGATPTGSVTATWLQLNADRLWELQASAGTLLQCVLTIEIRQSASAAVVATATVDMTSDATP
jgi:hypothetical protein